MARKRQRWRIPYCRYSAEITIHKGMTISVYLLCCGLWICLFQRVVASTRLTQFVDCCRLNSSFFHSFYNLERKTLFYIITTMKSIALLATMLAVATAYSTGPNGCSWPSTSSMGPPSAGTNGVRLTAYSDATGEERDYFYWGDTIKISIESDSGPYKGFLLHTVTSGSRFGVVVDFTHIPPARFC